MAALGMHSIPFLLSVSMAAPKDDESETTSNSCESTSLFVVKNTFIEIPDADVLRVSRRSSSAPPASRGIFSKYADDVGMWRTTSSPGSVSTHKECSSTTSTCDGGEGDADSSDTASVTSCLNCTSLRLADLLESPVSPPRARLSSKAKAWTPDHLSVGLLNVPPEVRSQFAEVMATGHRTLKDSGFVQHVSLTEGALGWSVLVFFKSPNLQDAQRALTLTQEALLGAAEASSGVYVLGYETTPFTPNVMGLGFSAKLAMVQDECSTCWDLLKNGSCNRGCSCRWKHPSWHAAVKFSMQFV